MTYLRPYWHLVLSLIRGLVSRSWGVYVKVKDMPDPGRSFGFLPVFPTSQRMHDGERIFDCGWRETGKVLTPDTDSLPPYSQMAPQNLKEVLTKARNRRNPSGLLGRTVKPPPSRLPTSKGNSTREIQHPGILLVSEKTQFTRGKTGYTNSFSSTQKQSR